MKMQAEMVKQKEAQDKLALQRDQNTEASWHDAKLT